MKKFLSQAPLQLIGAFAAFSMAASVAAQSLGTVSLDASLAAAGAQVVGVHNRSNGAALGYCEGPSADAQGSIFFTEGTPNRIWKVTGAAGTVFGGNTAYASNGTEFDAQGRLTVCQKEAIATYDATGNRTVLATTEAGIAPNDLTIGSNGAMYFSNWGQFVFYRNPAGQISKFTGYSTSNGIEWVEERKKLYLSQDGPDQVWVYDVATDGKLSNGKMFVAVPEPDGLTVDELGNLYVASWMDGKVYVYDTTGKALGSVTVTGVTGGQGTTNGQGGNTSNVVIGADKKLYITGDGGLYSVQLKVGPRVRPGSTGLREGLIRVDPKGLRLSRGVFNPLLQGLGIGLPVGGGRFSVRVFDARFREVWSAATGDAGLEWNGLNSSGEALPSGRYLILAQGAGGRKSLSAPVDIVRR